ncbi:putative mediator of RNA polymerase II transcription subunit 26b [Cocos nucifera]|uniref:Putative mediator of RNA polymerase II transcription subunit 26b n=1 Tax=Cocos nucifera TaxID=13894 RepID=A0A8K0INU3_COCNU|nr:putative mediator of RNA polymerase II transcription subunit 26b [Cocos nucifera]
MFEEILRIKKIIATKHDQSNSVLFDSWRRLQLMELSVETLKATKIGRAVNGLWKHDSKQIRHLVCTLIDGWKVLVDEWVSATAAIADNSPASPSVVDEEGLPSPPLDERALLATQTTCIQLSEFFDGMDDNEI